MLSMILLIYTTRTWLLCYFLWLICQLLLYFSCVSVILEGCFLWFLQYLYGAYGVSYVFSYVFYGMSSGFDGVSHD